MIHLFAVLRFRLLEGNVLKSSSVGSYFVSTSMFVLALSDSSTLVVLSADAIQSRTVKYFLTLVSWSSPVLDVQLKHLETFFLPSSVGLVLLD